MEPVFARVFETPWHLEQGPVTDGYKADRTKVIAVLNEVLATELVCVLRYKRHYFMASGIHAEPVAPEFLQHANEEQVHADTFDTIGDFAQQMRTMIDSSSPLALAVGQ